MKNNKKKMNSYLKVILWMCVGAVFGGTVGFLSNFAEGGVESVLGNISSWIGSNVTILMWILSILTAVLCVLAYRKDEALLRKMEQVEDEELQDQIDYQFDVWSSFGVAFSGVSIFLGIILFLFITHGTNQVHTGSVPPVFAAIIPFLILGVFSSWYQIAAVRQMRRKDPSKKGDATDLHFQKDWLESCDEAERRIIYQSSYKTFNLMKIILMIALILAMFGQLLWSTGMTAVVLIGLCYAIMLIGYTIYSLKLQKAHLDK